MSIFPVWVNGSGAVRREKREFLKGLTEHLQRATEDTNQTHVKNEGQGKRDQETVLLFDWPTKDKRMAACGLHPKSKKPLCS